MDLTTLDSDFTYNVLKYWVLSPELYDNCSFGTIPAFSQLNLDSNVIHSVTLLVLIIAEEGAQYTVITFGGI